MRAGPRDRAPAPPALPSEPQLHQVAPGAFQDPRRGWFLSLVQGLGDKGPASAHSVEFFILIVFFFS